MQSESVQVIRKEPWYNKPPRAGLSLMDMEWGYLYTYSDGSFKFALSEVPTLDEIMACEAYNMTVKPHLE